VTIELKNEYLTVQFKTLGGQLTSIKDKDGLEYLWQADPNYWNGQAPILFPICGSLRNDWAIYRLSRKPLLQVLFVDMVLFEKKNLLWKKSMIIA
jgi:hypothetical protein